MNRRTLVFFLPSTLFVAACTQTGSITNQTALPEIPSGKALIVFYRPAAFAGAAIRFNVNHASGPVGQLTSGAVLYKIVDPEPQTFWSQVISQDSIVVTPAPGQTLYVRGEVKMGLYAGRPSFSLVSASLAQQELG